MYVSIYVQLHFIECICAALGGRNTIEGATNYAPKSCKLIKMKPLYQETALTPMQNAWALAISKSTNSHIRV